MADDPQNAESSASEGPSSRQPRLLWLAVGLSTLIALLATGGAIWAMAQADQAFDLASDAKERAIEALTSGDTSAQQKQDQGEPGVEPDPPGHDENSSPTIPADEPTLGEETEPPPIQPGAEYVLQYEGEVLNPIASGNDTYIDVDVPRIVTVASDLQVDLCGTVCFRVSGDAAIADSATVTAEDCGELLRTSLLPPDDSIPVQRGLVVCVRTSREVAEDQGIAQLIVRLEVIALDGAQASLRLAAWEVPR